MPTSLDPNLLEQLKTMLRRDLKLGPQATITDDMPLFGGELDLDSLDVLLLVTNIEKQLGVRIPNEAVGETIFRDVKTLATFIQDHRGSAPARSSVVQVVDSNWLSKLPHGESFRFVSRISQVEPGKSATGSWLLNGSEPFFAGHFPGRPIVPGVLIAEALAQISGLAGPSDAPAEGQLAQVDVRFEKAVAPPVEIELRATLNRMMGALQVCDVEARVGGEVIARGSITLVRGAKSA